MTISDTIRKLQDIKEALGDIDLQFWGMEKAHGLYAFISNDFLVEVLEVPGGKRFDLRAVEDWEMEDVSSQIPETIIDG